MATQIELSELTWESLSFAEDPSRLFSTFYDKLNKLINKCGLREFEKQLM